MAVGSVNQEKRVVVAKVRDDVAEAADWPSGISRSFPVGDCLTDNRDAY